MAVLRSSCALVVAVTFMLLSGPAAHAAAGTITDPRGDGDPDIVKVTYSNARSQIKMSMTYADISLAQNESFYLRWGTGKSYQVFNSNGLRELRYYSSKNAATKRVACAGLKVARQTAKDTTAVTIPRSCLKKAPDKVRFQGIATMGLSSKDETKTSKLIARG
ncbi:MAG: hypothetical protein QOE19_1119 [Actinomycetota bacterium]|jgi:hypothetical protein|nr:hypothetical protein [Actinomycetota bacterium]